MTLVYRQCSAGADAEATPHEPHFNDDHTRCLGAPERDDRARTYNPKGRA